MVRSFLFLKNTIHELKTTTCSLLSLIFELLSGKAEVYFHKSQYIQLKFIFNWNQYLDLMKGLGASLYKSVDITWGLVKENSSNQKKSSLQVCLLMKGALVCIFNSHLLKIILAAFCYNSFSSVFVNWIFSCPALLQDLWMK